MPTDTVSAHLTPATGPGYDYGVADLAVTINPGIIVQSHDDAAVYSIRNGSELINHGWVYSANQGAGVGFGVYFVSGGEITNAADGTIIGTSGILSDNSSGMVINRGLIKGLQGDGVLLRNITGSDVLKNFGSVIGSNDGVSCFGVNNGTHTYENHGLIASVGDASVGNYGIEITASNGVLVKITNFAGATIKGPDAGIFTMNSSHVALVNNGTVGGGIDFNANGADNVINHGKIAGQVHLGPGNDTYNGTGGTSGKVFGEDGVDTLIGGKSGDQLDGGVGADVLRGARGRDLLTGGSEADRFDFNSIKDSVKSGKRDVIADFHHSEHDRIDLKGIDANVHKGGNQSFSFIGKHDFHGKERELHYVKHGSSVTVEGDVNGDGHADFQIKLDQVGSLAKGDFVV